jgi:hypothetical protein
MFAALLRVLLRRWERRVAARAELPIRVDRIEVNHYWWAAGCESHQVILWRWSEPEGRFKAERFFFIGEGTCDMPRRISGHRWRFTYRSQFRKGCWLIFETDDLIETVTAHDPWNRARAS